MKIDIKVPAMGESISEATIGSIMKPSGSRVSADDELLELETDKVNQVLYAPQAGVVSFQVSPEQVVKIGQVIGYIDTEAPSGTEPKKEAKSESKVVQQKPQEKSQEKPKKTPKEPLKSSSVSPSTSQESPIRKGKEEFLQEVKEWQKRPQQALQNEPITSSITSSEKTTLSLEPAQERPSPEKPFESAKFKERGVTRRKMSKIRKVIGSRLVEVQHTAAMLTTFNEVDMTQVIALREKYKDQFQKSHQVKLGFMSFFVKAAVSALQAFPDFNSYIDGDDIVHRDYYDIGVAVGTDRGVIVPVIRDCDQLTFAGIESALENFAKKAREGSINVDDLQGGGFTITNGGVYGSLLSTPILNPLQSGILGMHKIEKRPVVIGDQIVIRSMMYLALSYDHRIVDGKEAVSFLVHLKNCLEDPSRLLLEV